MLLTDIQIIQDIWPQLASIVRVPRTESDYPQCLGLRADLITLIGENENHRLTSLLEVVEALIEKYKLDRESTECETVYRYCLLMLAEAYVEGQGTQT